MRGGNWLESVVRYIAVLGRVGKQVTIVSYRAIVLSAWRGAPFRSFAERMG